jgi:hypothetical protein
MTNDSFDEWFIEKGSEIRDIAELMQIQGSRFTTAYLENRQGF